VIMIKIVSAALSRPRGLGPSLLFWATQKIDQRTCFDDWRQRSRALNDDGQVATTTSFMHDDGPWVRGWFWASLAIPSPSFWAWAWAWAWAWLE
ncbi:hypothetical protein CMV_027954, partial [Castanea mollissima]